MSEYKVKQIQPNHADHISYYRDKYLEEMLTTEDVIAQPKYDGERMLIHINGDEIYCTSRRFSKKTDRYMENQDKLPILKEYFKDFKYGYTVIDCECYSRDWSTIVGILHSLPERAIELQKTNIAKFACFDCLYFDGIDLRDLPYQNRFYTLIDLMSERENENLHLVNVINSELKPDDFFKTSSFHPIRSTEEWKRAMENCLEAGFEGVVLKSFERAYYDKGACLKCKKFETVDVVICGYQDGRGKYEGSVGALNVGYFDPESDSFVKISNVNCGTDEERELFNKNRDSLIGAVIEVKCQEITSRSLRHPVYIRLREDKDYKMCTRETIFKE